MAQEQYIYQNTPDNANRFVIGTVGNNPLIVMSINPSVGSPTQTSSTLGSVRHIAADYGYDSWIILCLYPQRATHLDELTEFANQDLINENNKVIDEILSKFPNRKIWAAWGTHYFDRPFFAPCLAEILKIADKYGDTWMHYGPLDEDGAPRYCLYLEPGEGWYPFDCQAFVNRTNF